MFQSLIIVLAQNTCDKLRNENNMLTNFDIHDTSADLMIRTKKYYKYGIDYSFQLDNLASFPGMLLAQFKCHLHLTTRQAAILDTGSGQQLWAIICVLLRLCFAKMEAAKKVSF